MMKPKTPDVDMGETKRQPRSLVTGRWGSKSGESQKHLGHLVGPHDSGSSILTGIVRDRAPNAWNVLGHLMR